ncbi:selenide, water dikinase-like [Orussus abietinus]|uniref:selenide, water dikinase-like n=1 Tax=Orussus abietinus TaxID=222816 RepID=UPI00062697D9|nr:selenide, water dikinase-like [Orussus abietinus]
MSEANSKSVLRDRPSMFALTTGHQTPSTGNVNVSGGGDAVNLEVTGDPSCPAWIPFDPSEHGLSPDFRLTKFGDPLGRINKPTNESFRSLLSLVGLSQDQKRESSDQSHVPSPGDDTTTVTKLDHLGLHLLESSHMLCPIIEDPHMMGMIACAGVLSGIYCLGVTQLASVRMTLGVPNNLEGIETRVMVSLLIRGFKAAAKSANLTLQSVQLVSNPWFMVGGSASAVCYHHELVPPDGATIGDVIVLTKPLGTMVAVTVSHWMEQPKRRNRMMLAINEEDAKRALFRAVDCMTRTNRVASVLMRKYNAHAACEVAHLGILGHAEMLVRRQKNNVSFVIHNMPVIAKMTGAAKITGNVLPLMEGRVPEVSGGLLVVLPREQAAAYCKALEKTEQRQAWIVGIVENGYHKARVIDRPRVIEVPPRENGTSIW